ncbi:MAG TPA: ROK family protein [Verrucomicrobiae bacterium]|nr:ROK family protein [Verrucomicrobiae bacterium]
MSSPQHLYLGTDSGATTTKINAVWENEEPVSRKVFQRPTNSQQGTTAVISGWIESCNIFLQEHHLTWAQVNGVGLAIPGPYQRYGVLDRSANLPPSFAGWDVHEDYSRALAQAAGRPIPLVMGNDGQFGGVAEARYARKDTKHSVLMLMPGSGLGCAYIDQNGLPLPGDTLASMEGAHMPAPLQMLGGIKPFPCGCGRDWGCFEVYTTISGLPHLLEEKLKKFPNHELATATGTPKEKALSLRGRAQKGDALALEIFDFQARAMGLHIANLTLAFDAGIVIIGGGLMDTEATTPEFRERYLKGIRAAAEPYFWPAQRKTLQIVPAVLGELSQAIGAALVALYRHRAGVE